MTVMNDFFKRGYQFDGATGEKSGANLEDLATRLVPTAGSQLVDDSSLQIFADTGGIVDDAGVAINRVRVKAGGITEAMLASKVQLGTLKTLVSGDIVAGGITGISDYSNMLDGDDATLTAEGSYSTAAYVYVDLGSAKDCVLRIVADFKASSAAYWCSIPEGCWGYSSATPMTAALPLNIGYNNCMMVTGTTYETVSILKHLYARYVGLRWQCEYASVLRTGYVKFRRFDVYEQ